MDLGFLSIMFEALTLALPPNTGAPVCANETLDPQALNALSLSPPTVPSLGCTTPSLEYMVHGSGFIDNWLLFMKLCKSFIEFCGA